MTVCTYQASLDLQLRSERLNWLTHAVGMVLSMVGGAFLLPRMFAERSNAVSIACLVFVLSMIAVYLFSALSHKITEPRGRDLFRRLDQAFIYILIVATFTPFTAAFLNHPWWYGVIGIMWFVAITGFVSKIFFAHRVDRVAVWFYLLLGWTPVLGGICTSPLLPSNVIWLIALGGFSTP